MSKIFLSHSSQDKNYVEIVAKKLGRARIVFDTLTFSPGQDFRQEILKHLDQSTHFIFFASQYSLRSVWCKYEWEYAEMRMIENLLSGSLCIIIDRETSFKDLPSWFQNTKAIIETRTSQAVRDIQHLVFSSLAPHQRKPFLGREDLMNGFSETISNLTDLPKRVFAVSGLEGIGRKTYLENVCRNNLGMELGPFFPIDNTRDLTDLYMWAVDETKEVDSRYHWAEEMKAFRALDPLDQIREVINRLHVLASSNCVPCLIDTGGLLDDAGRYLNEYQAILNSFCSHDEEHYLALIHRRKPDFRCLTQSNAVLFQRVDPLKDHSVMTLLTQLLRGSGNSTSVSRLSGIEEYIGGYPPSVYFAAKYISEYGIDVLKGNTSDLIDFKARRFTQFLKQLSLTDSAWVVMQYLAAEETVPFSTLAIATKMDDSSLAVILKALIDICLVMQADESYFLSKPIKDAVFRIKPFLSASFYSDLGKRLTDAFWKGPNAKPSIEIVDATLHAVARSGSLDIHPYENLVRPSTLHRLAQECYHKKEWDKAIQYAERTLQLDRKRWDVRSIRFKALVQQAQWEEAEIALTEIERAGDRQFFYLKGFMLRKMRKHTDAIKAFQSALDIGDRSNAVYRDYAECLYRCGHLKEAINKLNMVLERDTENKYVLDLMIRICLDYRILDKEKAEEYLNTLEKVDIDERFIHHRKASLMQRKGQYQEALIEAEAACRTQYSPFEAYAQKIDILIEIHQIDEAKREIEELTRRFPRHQQDVRHGLRCKILLREQKWREAQTVWNMIEEKKEPVNRYHLMRILELKSEDNSINLSERSQARAECQSIRDNLGTYDRSFPDLSVEDEVDIGEE